MSASYKAMARFWKWLEAQDAVLDPETPERMERCRQEKARQLARAREAGIIQEEADKKLDKA